MRSDVKICGPNELKVLDRIVRATLQELRSAGLVSNDNKQVRLRIGKQVLRHIHNDILNVERIKMAVIANFNH